MNNLSWLNGDITVLGYTFRHGDNGVQEFYEAVVPGIQLGLFRNHGENVWIAFTVHGDAVRVLNSATQRPDGGLNAGPLYGMANDPAVLAEGLIRLWREHEDSIF